MKNYSFKYHNASAVVDGYVTGTTDEVIAPTFNGTHWKAERDGSIRVNSGRLPCEFGSPILQGGEGVSHFRATPFRYAPD